MENETVTYASYLARLVGFIAALILIGLAVWLVVGGDDNPDTVVVDEAGVVATTDETTGAYNITKDSSEDTAVASSSENSDRSDSLVATDTQVAAATTSDTGELPDTGPGQSALGLLAVTLFAVATKGLISSRRELKTTPLVQI